MSDDMETVFTSEMMGASYIESLVKCRQCLDGALLAKLDLVIDIELDLALLGSTKAKSEVLKANAKDNMTRIK